MSFPVILEKTCTKCNQTLPIQYFSRDAVRKDGYRNVCKSCSAKYPKFRADYRGRGYVDTSQETGVTKECPSCEEVKDTIYFGKDKQRWDGLTTYCLQCKRDRWQKYASKKNPKKAQQKKEAS